MTRHSSSINAIGRRAFLALPAAALAAGLPPVLLNHFYATVDSRTYAAIEASEFLKTHFAPFEKRTTVRNDSTYSGLYFYGDQTYFEFFEENQGDRKPGDAGVALGIETAGGSEALREAWNQLRPSIITTVTRQLEGKPADWFRMTSFEETRAQSAVEGLRLFSMEYVAGFAARWYPQGGESISQRAILNAYCEKLGLGRVRAESWLANVEQLEISSPRESVDVRVQQLTMAGWKVALMNGRVSATGPNARVIFTHSARPIGVTRITFKLKGQPKPQQISIGATRLEITPRQAIWTLHP